MAAVTDQAERYDRIAQGYERWWAPVLAPSAAALLDRLDADRRRQGASTCSTSGSGTGNLALAGARALAGRRGRRDRRVAARWCAGRARSPTDRLPAATPIGSGPRSRFAGRAAVRGRLVRRRDVVVRAAARPEPSQGAPRGPARAPAGRTLRLRDVARATTAPSLRTGCSTLLDEFGFDERGGRPSLRRHAVGGARGRGTASGGFPGRGRGRARCSSTPSRSMATSRSSSSSTRRACSRRWPATSGADSWRGSANGSWRCARMS